MQKIERHSILELAALGRSLSRAQYPHAELEGANLRGADLQGADLRYANLSRADLRGAHLGGANLSRANLSGAFLSRADLGGANLDKTDLSYADLSRASFEGAQLTGSDLRVACLEGANLRLANLSWADLSRANLSRCDLSRADLRYSRLIEVDLTGAILDGVKIYGASLFATRNWGVTCRSLDASREGDSSRPWTDNPAEWLGLHHQPSLRLEVRARLDHQIHALIGILYLQLSQQFAHLPLRPPVVEAHGSRTRLSFEVTGGAQIAECARVVCFPFSQCSQFDWPQLAQLCGDESGRTEALPLPSHSIVERIDLFLESAAHLFGSTQLPPFFNAEVFLEMWGESARVLFVGPGQPARWSEADPWLWMTPPLV